MKKILYMLLVALCFTACDNDDDYTKEVFSADSFDGEWLLCDESDPQSVTEVKFTPKGYSYQSNTYVNTADESVLYDIYYGFYSYIRSTNAMRINAKSEFSGDQHTYDFEVKSIGKYSMLLVNKSFNSYDVYSRLVHKATILVGGTIGNAYLSECGFTASEFVSLNPNIASVDESGNITAVSSGTTYIIAKSGEEKIAVKVTAETMAKTYASLIYNATFDDVFEKLGEPDKISEATATSMGLVYNNPSFDPTLKGLAVYIDADTGKVTRILAQYKSDAAYLSDVKYVKKSFYEVDYGDTYYCDVDEFLASRVHIYPFESNGNYYIAYGSTYFVVVNGHY